jgi:chromosome segregation ATPase
MSERATIASLQRQVNEFRLAEAALAQLDAQLADRLAGDQARLGPPDHQGLATTIATEAARALGAVRGALFLPEPFGRDTVRLAALFGGDMPAAPLRFAPGEGLTGQALQVRTAKFFANIPLPVSSSLGQVSTPCFLAVSPLLFSGRLFGVLELASVTAFETFETELLEKISLKAAFFLYLHDQLRQAREVAPAHEVERTLGSVPAPEDPTLAHPGPDPASAQWTERVAELQDKLGLAHQIIRNYELARQGEPQPFTFDQLLAQATAAQEAQLAAASQQWAQQLATTQADADRWAREVADLRAQLATAQQRAHDLAQEAELRAGAADRAQAEAAAQLADRERQLAEKQKTIVEIQAREAELASQLAGAEATCAELSEQLRQAEQALATADAELAGVTQHLAEAQVKQQALAMENASLTKDLTAAQQAQEALAFSLGEAEQQQTAAKTEAEAQLAQAQARLAEAQKLAAEAQDRHEMATSDLERQLALAQQQVADFHATLEATYKTALADAQEAQRDRQTALDAQALALAEAQGQADQRAETELARLAAELDTAQQTVAEQSQALAQLADLAQEYEAQLQLARSLVREHAPTLAAHSPELAQAQAELAEVRDQLEASRGMLLRKEAELADLRRGKPKEKPAKSPEAIRLEQAVAALQAELEATATSRDSQVAALNRALADRDRTLAEATSLASEYNYQLNLAREELRRLRAEVEDLARELDRR